MSEAKPSALTVRAEWDPAAGVWVAESDDVPGLVTEAETLERLIERLCMLVPELFELNGLPERLTRSSAFPYLRKMLEGA